MKSMFFRCCCQNWSSLAAKLRQDGLRNRDTQLSSRTFTRRLTPGKHSRQEGTQGFDCISSTCRVTIAVNPGLGTSKANQSECEATTSGMACLLRPAIAPSRCLHCKMQHLCTLPLPESCAFWGQARLASNSGALKTGTMWCR